MRVTVLRVTLSKAIAVPELTVTKNEVNWSSTTVCVTPSDIDQRAAFWSSKALISTETLSLLLFL